MQSSDIFIKVNSDLISNCFNRSFLGSGLDFSYNGTTLVW